MDRIKHLAIKAVLIILFLISMTVIIAPLMANVEFKKARRLEIGYRWNRSTDKYKSAIRFDPLNTRHIAGYADFLVRKSPYHKDEALWLDQAKRLYRRALDLNPRSSEYWYKLGVLEAPAMGYFERAVSWDPNGFYTSYLVGYAGVPSWGLLDEKGRELIVNSLRYVLKNRPWYARRYIYPRVWQYTKDFRVLQKITPSDLETNKALFFFVIEHSLGRHYMEQKRRLDFYREKERPEDFESERAGRLGRIENMKKNFVLHQSPKSVILREDWQGASERDKNNIYKNGSMYWTGTIDAVIGVPAGEALIEIQAKGREAHGIWPFMIIQLDGEEIAGIFINNAEWERYKFKVNTDGGLKVLSVTFTNDAKDRKKGEDRNLFIGEAKAVKLHEEQNL